MTDTPPLGPAAAEFWEGRCLDCAHPQHEMTCHELVPNGDPSNGPAYCPCAVQIDWMEQEIVRQREAIEPLLALVRAAVDYSTDVEAAMAAMWHAVSGQDHRPADKTWTYRYQPPPSRLARLGSRLRRLIGWWRGG